MTPLPEEQLILAAAELSNASPARWKEFVDAFTAYTARKRDTCVQSAPDRIFQAQGMAQECNVLLRLFEECRRTSEAIRTKQGKR